MSFIPLYKIQRSKPTGDDKLLLLDRSGKVLLQQLDNKEYTIPEVKIMPQLQDQILPQLGHFRGKLCFGCRLENGQVPPAGVTPLDVREALTAVAPAVKSLLLRGKPILEWLYNRSYCSACGNKLQDHEQEEARVCPNCGMLFFPKISPAVIVLIKREDGRILLAHNCKFREKVYSLIAGFVEAGESAEDAVRREVREEVGLEIKNIQYKYSQSWPFPDSLMLGFTAEYAAGEVTPDGEEIVDADFYRPDELPALPGKSSIARRIIDEYIAEQKK
ncbi:MAG: NAD(+) diphosphatase [Lentisphaerae bacterium]|nr:NAD(+) diphosphatase [Lentisphaerota bacterium]